MLVGVEPGSPNAAGPVIAVDPSTVDFGTLATGSTALAVVRVSNAGGCEVAAPGRSGL
jgi:hypothetical protein